MGPPGGSLPPGTGGGVSAVSTALQLALPLDQPPDLVARLRRKGLSKTVAVSFHRNRQVMVTLDPRRGLGIHRGYAWAPDDVLEAVVRWAQPRLKPCERRAAARVMLAFPVHNYVPEPPPRRVVEPAEPGDQTRLDRLRKLHRELNDQWFDGALGPIPIRLSGRMRRKLAHYESRADGASAIVISRRHVRRHGWKQVIDTLLHEMVHQWQDESGLTVDHGPGFRAKAREVGIEPRAVSRLL